MENVASLVVHLGVCVWWKKAARRDPSELPFEDIESCLRQSKLEESAEM